MQEKSLNKTILISIFLFGIFFRLVLFVVSPPNNAFDDHLEVINLYAKNYEQPLASECWECYQPPVYYTIGALVYKSAINITFSTVVAWKLVQLINPILSIFILILFYKIIKRFNSSEIKRNLYLSFIAVLPIDLFTSAMTGNDYILVFFAVLSLFYFLKTFDDIKNFQQVKFNNYIYLSTSVILGSLSKQHGLILIVFPSIILIFLFFRRAKLTYTKFIPLFLLVLILSASNEFWKYSHTGKFLVSNQDYYNYAVGQFPGTLDKIDFFSFKINSLYKEPFISNQTAASFPTEIFARIFFDYEWRFLNPKIHEAILIGRLGYTLGLIWMVFFSLTSLLVLWKRKSLKVNLTTKFITFTIPILVAVLFFAVPVIQTIRFPYFSSMKSTFALSGIIMLLIMHSCHINELKINKKLVLVFIILNLTYGIALIYAIYTVLPSNLNHLSGPLWPIP